MQVDKILLVRLYNRLSFYMCNQKYQNALKDVDKNLTVEELLKKLDELYINHLKMNPITIRKINLEKKNVN